MRRSGIRVAPVVGTVAFAINHGATSRPRQNDASHWLSALVTYGIPYAVNSYGQGGMQKTQAPKWCQLSVDKLFLPASDKNTICSI
ncbi:MAG: nitrate/nitrite transporter NrtS [Leptolyngbyaceae cyanobacterium]